MTLPELAQLVGIEYRTLHTWVRRGLLRPSLRASSGTGTANLFGFGDAVAAQILADLRRGGLGFDQLERAAEALAEHPAALCQPALLVINGSAQLLPSRNDAADALGDGLTLVYDTSAALARVEHALAYAAA